jgi:hypothetical protein
MNLRSLTLAPVLLASFGLAASAQQAQGGQGLERVVPLDSEEARLGLSTAFDAELWSAHLTDADLGRRELRYGELVRTARRDPAARAWVEERANDASAPELAWTCRLALRELRGGAAGGGGRMHHGSHGAFPGVMGPGSMGADPRALLEELQRELGAMRQGALPRGFGLQLGPGAGGHSSSFQLQTTPDGVKVTVRERGEDGAEEVREYEASSMEELLEAHPELRRHMGGSGGGARGLLPGFLGGGPAAVPTEVLGVYARELGAGEAEARSLAPDGPGLYVLRVQPGTMAHGLGLMSGDVLLEVNEVEVCERDDIRRGLEARGPDGAVNVRWVDVFGRERARTWQGTGEPAAEPVDENPAEEEAAAGRREAPAAETRDL